MKLWWPRAEGHRERWASRLSLTAAQAPPVSLASVSSPWSGQLLLTPPTRGQCPRPWQPSGPSVFVRCWQPGLGEGVSGHGPLSLVYPPRPVGWALHLLWSLLCPSSPGQHLAHGGAPAVPLTGTKRPLPDGQGQGQGPGRACPHHRTCWDSGGSDCCRRVFPRRSKSSRPLLVGRDVCAGGRLSTLGAGAGWGGSVPSDDCWAYKGCGWVRRAEKASGHLALP